MNRSPQILCLFLLAWCMGACDIINPEETIPARIQLKPVVLEVEPGQGTARHKITEVWVYANSNLLGAFTPPAEVHYTTAEALANFNFWAGIRNNGILDDAIIYPMYATFPAQLTTTSGSLSEVNPIYRYKPEVVFSLVSDFETHNDFINNRDSIPESILVQSSEDAFEGNYSGEITLDSTAYFIEVTHAIAMNSLPKDGKAIYLELHYKTEVPLEIDLLGITLNGQDFANPIYLLKPNEEWNKIYIELTDWVLLSDLPSYKIVFKAAYPIQPTQPSYKIRVDNIQVLHL